MNIAIKGHPTRGRGVIQLLEMLGGKNALNLDGVMDNYYYCIDENSNKIYHCLSINLEYGIIYTLEEFEEKFPYKVDDIVVNHKYGKGDITQMLWIDDEIVYEIHFEDCMAYCKANELCKYDASKGLLLQELTEYLSHATREELDKTMEEIEIALAPFKVGDKVIVKGYEKMGEDEVICVFKTYFGDIKYKTNNHLNTHYFMEDSLTRVKKSNKEENMRKRTKIVDLNPKLVGERKVKLVIPHDWEIKEENGEIFLQDKRSQYPKTYKECCEVLGIDEDLWFVYEDIDGNHINPACISNYRKRRLDLYHNFEKLSVCRDAYWKVYGEQIGLGKPWVPNWNSDEDKFCIETYRERIIFDDSQHINRVLAFPTEEMRDTFFENFKGLINECKELL